ncbi:MAG: lipoprotein [Psychromonas sp.]
MKNIKLLSMTLLFSSLLAGCGMTGPLYRETPPTPQVEQQKADSEENSEEATLKDSEAKLEDSEETVAD